MIYDRLWNRDEQYDEIQDFIYLGFEKLLDLYLKRGESIEELEKVIEAITQEQIKRSRHRGFSRKDQLIEELKTELSESHKKNTDTNDKLNTAYGICCNL